MPSNQVFVEFLAWQAVLWGVPPCSRNRETCQANMLLWMNTNKYVTCWSITFCFAADDPCTHGDNEQAKKETNLLRSERSIWYENSKCWRQGLFYRVQQILTIYSYYIYMGILVWFVRYIHRLSNKLNYNLVNLIMIKKKVYIKSMGISNSNCYFHVHQTRIFK